MLAWFAAISLTLHPADSLSLLRGARAAQEAFERFRIDHLPRSFGGTDHRCDEVVGRFCFWHDDEDDPWTPPPEHPGIGLARRELIARLDSVAHRLPGDGWTAGQRVRYLVEAGDAAGALRAAAECRAERWWCLALTGYAHHAAQTFAAADTAFDAALRDMPREERCQWTDLSPLVERPPASYRQESCEERAGTERLVWWLADPLYLVPGNERRTEHYARHVMNRMQAGARSGYGVRWGDDLRELLLRYGWPIGFTRNESRRSIDATGTSVTAHHDPVSRRFLPDPDLGELDPDRPRSSYAPPYAASVEELEPQIAVFRRGDSAVVVAGYDLSRAPRFPSGVPVRVEAALVVVADPQAEPIVARQHGSGPVDVLALISPGQPGLISVEALARADTIRAYRARERLPVAQPPNEIGVSDPLLLRVGDEDSLPVSLEDAIPEARGSARIPSGQRLGLFWEMYGLDRQRVGATVSLTVTKTGAGFLRRAAEWAGLASRYRPSVSLSWVEPPAAQRVHPRSLVITLPETSPGTYVLKIAARSADGDTASAKRVLTIEEPKRK